MNDDQKEWSKQYSANLGMKEFLRFGCAFAIWQAIGIGLTIWSGNIGYVLICMSFYFIFPTLTAYWQPAHSMLRKILGNKNIPPQRGPFKFKWWNYIPLAIRLGISAILLVKGIEFLVK